MGIYYYRCSPDRRRILFGGRVSYGETDPPISGQKLQAEMVHLFPELRDARISHSWCGFIAYKFDDLMRIGQQVLGLPQGRTALDDVAFQTRPLYTGNP